MLLGKRKKDTHPHVCEFKTVVSRPASTQIPAVSEQCSGYKLRDVATGCAFFMQILLLRSMATLAIFA